jgi:hypothetical protein
MTVPQLSETILLSFLYQKYGKFFNKMKNNNKIPVYISIFKKENRILTEK